jgi:hypothetical protein
MTVRKVTSGATKGKSLLAVDFDHYLAMDWSQRTMAIAHMGRRAVEPVVFERDANLKALKEYLRTLRGSTEDVPNVVDVESGLKLPPNPVYTCHPIRFEVATQSGG